MQSLPCDVTISGQAFGPGSLTFGLQKNSSLLAELNQALLKVSAGAAMKTETPKLLPHAEHWHTCSLPA